MYNYKNIWSILNTRGDKLLKIDFEYKKGILFLRLEGILNKDTSSILENAIKKVVSKGGIKYLLINFEKIYEIDEGGISSIINSYKQYLKDNGKLIICGYNEKIKIKIENSKLLNYAFTTINEGSACNLIRI